MADEQQPAAPVPPAEPKVVHVATKVPSADPDPTPPGPPAEPAQETPKAEAAPDDERLRKGFSALSKKEKALRQKEQQLKTLEEQVRKAETLRQKAKDNPLEVLNEYGVTYEQLTDYILGNEKPAPSPEDKIRAIEERLERERQEAAEARSRAEQEAIERKIDQFKNHILKPSLQANADKYELINSRGDEGAELVFDVIEEYHKTHSQVLPWHVAADHVEQHLEQEGRKLLQLRKFRVSEGQSTAQITTAPVGDTLSRNRAGELPVVNEQRLPLDPEDRTRAVLKRNRLWA